MCWNHVRHTSREGAQLWTILIVIKHIILALDILDLENLDFVSVGKFMKS